MSHALNAVMDFARDIGLDVAMLERSHVLYLESDSGVAVVVEEAASSHATDWLVYAAAPLPFNTYAVAQRTLLYAHASRAGPWRVQVAVTGRMADKRLVFSLRLAQAEVTPQRLHAAVACLYRWLDKYASRGWNDL